MKVGIGYREFAEIAKCAFVDVSTSDYGLRGRPTNISRVAVMTGLTRKEVKRIRGVIEEGTEIDTSKVVPPIEILHRWHTDTTFVDDGGKPKILPFEGTDASFASLVRRYGGDIPPGAMRTELKRVKAIEENDDGSLRVVRRHFRPRDKEQIVESALGRSLFGLAHAINNNVDVDESEAWIQRIAWTSRIRGEDRSRVRRISRERIDEFLRGIDDLYSAYETIYPAEEIENSKTGAVGVGVYYFELADGGEMNYFRNSNGRKK